MQTQIAGCAKVSISSIASINLHTRHLRCSYFENNKKEPIDKVRFNSVPHCFAACKLCHKSRSLYFVHRFADREDLSARVQFVCSVARNQLVFHDLSREMESYEQYAATTAFVCPLYLLTIVLGSLGNGMVIYSYVADKSIHQTFYFLITNLAIADLLICLLFTPMLFIYRVYAKGEIIAYTPVCEISLFLSMFSISLMYFVFPLLAYHRKDVMLRPKNPRLSLPQARLVMYIFWFICILASVFIVLLARNEFTCGDTTPKLYRCLLINQRLDSYAKTFLGYSATLYGLSIFITAVIYVQIFRTLRTHVEGVNGSADERHVTKLCFWVAIVYTAFWTPFLLVQLGGVFGTYTELHFNLHGCSSAIGVIGSAVNPVLYAVMNPYYRTRLHHLFKKVTCRQ